MADHFRPYQPGLSHLPNAIRQIPMQHYTADGIFLNL